MSQAFDLSRARICAIVNTGSGRQEGRDIAARLGERLAGRVAQYEWRGIDRGAALVPAAQAAVAQGFDVVVAVGGDGTQAAVASALADSPAAMAVIPGGTFNYFARDLGVGETVDQALEVFDAPRLRRVDVGDINGTLFLNNASFGAYPEILRRRETIYRRWGRSRVAAYWSAAVALWRLRRPIRMRVHADGRARDITTALAFVAKSAYQLETFGLEGAADIREGRLALLTARARRPAPLIRSALRLAFGKSARYRDFDLFSAADMVIETFPAHENVAHDGEKTWMDSPFRIRMRPGALAVLVGPDPQGPDGA